MDTQAINRSIAAQPAGFVPQTAIPLVKARMVSLRDPELRRWPAGILLSYQAMLGSQDAKEGALAFAERRKPQWRGR